MLNAIKHSFAYLEDRAQLHLADLALNAACECRVLKWRAPTLRVDITAR